MKSLKMIIAALVVGSVSFSTMAATLLTKEDVAKNPEKYTKIDTIHTTGISIIYTSLVLIAGFVIFCFSGFGGTQALGWLTSLTLIVATFTNLILLPALLISSLRKRQ